MELICLPGYPVKTIPSYQAQSHKRQGDAVYYCNEGNYEIAYEQTNEEEVNAYAARLAAAGYTLYSEHRITDNRYLTYTSEIATVHIAWHPSISVCKVIFCRPDQYLPPVAETPWKRVCEPFLTLPKKHAQGMGYLLRLADGGFIVIDSGYRNDEDAAAIRDFMIRNTPAGQKPRIAAWMITHPHPDHMDLANRFLDAYHGEFDLDMAAYNFPELEHTRVITCERMDNNLHESFQRRIREYYPEAKHWIMHAGQVLRLAGAEIEVLFTHEEHYPGATPWGNHLCTTWRFRINGKTAIFAGDSERPLCDRMVDYYGEDLKSDILQMVHHGLNAATLGFYRAIDPKICMWACPEVEFSNDGRTLGLRAKQPEGQPFYTVPELDENGERILWKSYDFNHWIRNSDWTRGDETGARRHFHAGNWNTVWFDDALTSKIEP